MQSSQVPALPNTEQGAFAPPPTTVVYGLEGASKLEVIDAVLAAQELTYTVVKSRECLSQRHLLGKIFTACLHALEQGDKVEDYDRIDSLNALSVNLQQVFKSTAGKVVLVLDSVDEVKGAGLTMLPALARLGDIVGRHVLIWAKLTAQQIPGLSILFTTNSIRPLLLHRSGVPYIHFPAYTRSQAVYIQCLSLPVLPESPQHTVAAEELELIYKQFAVTVYDALIAPTSTSLSMFRNVCNKLWPAFIWPAISGEAPPGKATKWDFPRLLVRGRQLFHADGESALLATLQPDDQARTFEDLLAQQKKTASRPIDGFAWDRQRNIIIRSIHRGSPQQQPVLAFLYSNATHHRTPSLK